tara:strand:- start:638 stop:1771 length:1134 start_codon:yes stop_codon:yes gene_type:complete
MAIPSLALIPTGFKDGKLYSVLPESGVGDFDVVRGSGATRVNKDGLIETMASNEPRLDYTDGGCPSLLLEPQSTNLLTYSEDFSQWTAQSGITITANTTDTLSPSGLSDASKVVSANGATGFSSFPFNTTSDVTRTIYLKGSVGGENVTFKDGGGFGGSITHTLTTEWVRYEFKTTNDGNSYIGLFVDNISVGTIYAWGAQAEALTYATSYIPTSGAIATRLADSVSGAGDATTFNSTEGVLYFEGSALTELGDVRHISISNGSNDDRLYFYYSSSGGFAFASIVGGVLQANITFSGIITSTSKIACKYKENDYALWVNGVEVGTDTLASVWSSGTLNTLNFALPTGASFLFEGKVKDLRTYNTALTDAELLTLTTI